MMLRDVPASRLPTLEEAKAGLRQAREEVVRWTQKLGQDAELAAQALAGFRAESSPSRLYTWREAAGWVAAVQGELDKAIADAAYCETMIGVLTVVAAGSD